jgi:uncharacterized protein (TIGR02271 family)
MAQTVIGMFDNAAEAQTAVQQLTSRGISRDRIDVANTGSGSTGTSGSTDSYSDEHESGISKFFKNLFSSDDDDSDKYAHVARHSQSIVTVHAQTSDEAEQAADILDDCGAIDVDEKATSYGYSGRTGNTGNYSTGTGTSGLGSTAGNMTGNTDYNTTRDTDYDTTRNTNLDTTRDTDYDTTRSADLDTTRDRDYATTGSTNITGTTGSDTYNRNTDSTDETQRIPIIEENLEVGKREVIRGGTRLRSRIIERPVEESVRLREETVRVDRVPVDRAATSADLQNFSEREIEMTETAEVPVVTKEARVVEEVSLGKEVNERTETVSDTVRKTEVDVENLGTSDRDRTGTGYTDTNNNRNDL